jgi:hypothetical protein
MRNQNPPEIGCFVEDIGVWYADNPSSVRIRETDHRLTAARRPRTIFWLKSASAWERGLRRWGLAPRTGQSPAWNKAPDAYAELRLA